MSQYNKNYQTQQYVNSSLVQDFIMKVTIKTNCQPRIYGNGHMLRCPVHDDKNPSLSIREGNDGRVLLKCFAGCKIEDICSSINLNVCDLFLNQSR